MAKKNHADPMNYPADSPLHEFDPDGDSEEHIIVLQGPLCPALQKIVDMRSWPLPDPNDPWLKPWRPKGNEKILQQS
jgi:hypothetical protein